MDGGGKGIQIRHQPIPQLHVPQDAVVGRGAFRGNVPKLATRPLAVRAEQRNKRAELVPAGLQFLPFIGVGGIVELAHHRETADVHPPERNAAHGVIEAGRHLHAHVGPGCADVAAPGCRAVPLQAAEAVAREQEHPLVGVHAALSFVDGLGVHQGVGIEILGAGAQGIGREQPLHIIQGQAVPQVGLAGVHPPGVNLAAKAAVQALVHLFPEQLAATLGIGVIETLLVAQPVLQAVVLGMGIGIARLLELLVMVCIGVELGPDGNHESAAQGVHAVQHGFGVGIALRVKLMATPLIVLPVLPVLDDIVHRNVAAAHFGQSSHQVLLGGITLPALPEAQHPFGHHGRLAGELAVILDNTVVIVSGHKVIVGHRLELAPESEAVLLFGRLQGRYAQADVRYVPIRIPVDVQGRRNAFLQVDGELVAVGVPRRAPAAAHHFLRADDRALETGIVLDKVIIPGFAGRNGSVVSNLGAHQLHFRQVPDGPFILIEQTVFRLHHRLSFGRRISTGELQVKDFAQLPIRLGTSPAAQGIGVEQEAVALVGHHHGHADLGIVLVQFLPQALVIEFARLVLAQTVKGFVAGGSIAHRSTPGLFAFHFDGSEGGTAVQR